MTKEERLERLKAFSETLNENDFAQYLDEVASGVGIQEGEGYLLDQSWHKATAVERSDKGKVSYKGEWRYTPTGIRYPTATLRNYRGGEQSVYFDGYKPLIELFNQHLQGVEPEPRKPRRRRPAKKQRENRSMQKLLEREQREAREIVSGDPVDLYLRARGLGLSSWPSEIRYLPGAPYYYRLENGRRVVLGEYPTMVAFIRNVDGEVVGRHATYLDPEKPGKATIVDPETGEILTSRKMVTAKEGAAATAAIHLFEPGNVLALSEGIESALAVHQVTGLPVWPCLSAGGMRRVELPMAVNKVLICGEHDRFNRTTRRRASEHNCRLLWERMQTEWRDSLIVCPLTEGKDWLDALGTPEQRLLSYATKVLLNR
ncbi:DUF7146 domain-containing protein [Thioalkalivibrio thiocyanodenitrificans]|uniref:DUF7146 domain-containing protein n=1 Tax=Thioalkalivibrio thiocyanodenitrificans TaxID=243063 RepID=UPI000361BB12|nr:toprim domain-containing protein [Thioalkalivibrio thiocyanodenitrificans]